VELIVKRLVPLAVFLCLASISPALAELYKWVDEDGVVHYSQTPPENRQAAEVEVREDYPDASQPAGENVYADVIAQQAARKAEREKQAEFDRLERDAAAADEAADVRNCAVAVSHLNTLQKQCPVFYDGVGILRAACLNEGYYYYEGERTYIEDEERKELIAFYSDVARKCEDSR
jgi:hypothetical protein